MAAPSKHARKAWSVPLALLVMLVASYVGITAFAVGTAEPTTLGAGTGVEQGSEVTLAASELLADMIARTGTGDATATGAPLDDIPLDTDIPVGKVLGLEEGMGDAWEDVPIARPEDLDTLEAIIGATVGDAADVGERVRHATAGMTGKDVSVAMAELADMLDGVSIRLHVHDDGQLYAGIKRDTSILWIGMPAYVVDGKVVLRLDDCPDDFVADPIRSDTLDRITAPIDAEVPEIAERS